MFNKERSALADFILVFPVLLTASGITTCLFFYSLFESFLVPALWAVWFVNLIIWSIILRVASVHIHSWVRNAGIGYFLITFITNYFFAKPNDLPPVYVPVVLFGIVLIFTITIFSSSLKLLGSGTPKKKDS